jgi:aryl-alcohol dehydrogenase-like predicted oxidoreductase
MNHSCTADSLLNFSYNRRQNYNSVTLWYHSKKIMLYRQLGKSNLQISEIGFGCMSLGENDADNAQLIHKAIDYGINYFDTADIYNHGQNEISVGKALKHYREKIILATKVGNQWKKDGSGLDWNPSKEHILASIDESLARLQTDHIDLYQLHGGTINDPIDEIIETFENLQKQGKIRHYGISSIRPNVIREYINRSNIVSVMMQYSILDRRPEETCFDLLQKNNISVLARGAVAKGLLINKPPENYLNYNSDDVKKAADVVQSLSNEKRNNAQTAIRFVLNQKIISSAIVGIRTSQQLEEAVQTMNTPELAENEIQSLKNILPVNHYDQHR